MKKTTLALAISALACSSLAWAAAPNTDLPLMPYPQEVKLGKGVLPVDRHFTITLS